MSVDLSDCPTPLQDAVSEWLEEHPDDVVMKAEDGMDVLILSDDAEGVVWIDYQGRVSETSVRWHTLKKGVEDA